MTDLDAMVSWLRAQILAERAAAETVHREGCAYLDYHFCDCDVPPDVIADCEAKLALLDHYRKVCEHADPSTHPDQAYVLAKGAVEQAVRLLAQGYRHRDGYKQTWAS